ncbi:MAG: NIPSNAP family protein [Dehalococcoidia bacterium]|nr:NIPSNAP family protein [Dehalococcoidia bacterium]
MIYLWETFNVEPASPEGLDKFVTLAGETLLPAYERLRARLAAAWYSDIEWFCQVTQVLEFDDFAALGEFRERARQDEGWAECEKRLEEAAPERSRRLFEPFAVPPETLKEASAQSRETPLKVYTVAAMDVAPGKMAQLKQGMEAAAKALPLVANWRAITGKQNEVIDLWKGPMRQSGYEPSNEGTNQFFRGVRTLAPRERLYPVFALPYSPLR